MEHHETQDFLNEYTDTLSDCIHAIDAAQFARMIAMITETYKANGQIFVCGNGGSAATVNHFACDFGKNAVQDPVRRRFRILSLCDNVERLTAFGNDVSFEEIFSEQLQNLLNLGDLLLVVSASGNSPNILAACEYARAHGARVAALAGFDGGAVRKKSDLCIVAPLSSYEQIEDAHLILLHMVTCYVKTHPEELN